METTVLSLIETLPRHIKPIEPDGDSVVINSGQPQTFWGQFIGALQHHKPIAILDPGWPVHWKNQYTNIARGFFKACESDVILIPTGGSSGQPRLCIHSLKTLSTAANSFRERFLRDGYAHAVSVLPSNHIGGLMPVFRSAACGGVVQFSNYRKPVSSSNGVDLAQACISLVPTQLNRMLDSDLVLEYLKQFGLILVGGAACPSPLLQKCRELGLRLAPCYGSTETAAMVTVMHPDTFLAGESGVGCPLPGVRIAIAETQRVEIVSDSNLHGYVPEQSEFTREPYVTDDLGQIDSSGNLHIIGRADNIIITGGKKVVPEQVEMACWESGLVTDVNCSSLPDPEWGERVELDVVFSDDSPGQAGTLLSFLRDHLPAYAVPKTIRRVDAIKRNAVGKVSRFN